jgi:uncharacterized protein YndB with AHSA1/START domain
MVAHRIEREVVIDAPIDVVWAVVTEPEHISGWFSDSVEIELTPGGKALFHWDGRATVNGRVERVDPPRSFAFSWVSGDGVEPADGNLTMVEFNLATEGDATRLTVVESGFRELDLDEDVKQERFDGHVRGWEIELGELVEYVR